MNFINTGLDERILKSLDAETPSEDLIKAMNKQGLVQRDVQVKGKNGTFTRKQWVKAGDDQNSASASASTAPNSADTTHSVSLDSQRKLKAGSILCRKREKGGYYVYQKQSSTVGASWSVQVVTDSGKVSTLSGKEENKMPTDGFVDTPQIVKNHITEIHNPFLKEGPSFVDHKSSPKKTPDSPKKTVAKHSYSVGDDVILELSGRSISAKVVKIGDNAMGDTVYTVKETKSGSSSARTYTVPADKLKAVVSTKNSGQKSTGNSPKSFRSSSSVPDLANGIKAINRKLKSEFGVTNAVSATGGAGLGQQLMYVSSTKLNSVTQGDFNKLNSLIHEFVKKEFGKDVIVGHSGDEKNGYRFTLEVSSHSNSDSKSSQSPAKGSQNSKSQQNNSSDSSMFSLPTGKTPKQAVTELLGSHSRDDIMAAAKSAGITWKENDHDGINWMRASMAIQKYMSSSSSPSSYKSGTLGKDGSLTPKSGSDLAEFITEITNTDMFEQKDYALDALKKTGNFDDAVIESMSFDKAHKNGNFIEVNASVQGYTEDDNDNFDKKVSFKIPVLSTK